MSDRQDEVPKPHFVWRNFGRGVVVTLCDLGILVCTAVTVWCFIRFIVFHGTGINCNSLGGEDWSTIVKATAWPIGSFVTIFLFRNPILRILYEIPWFIRKSWYRAGGVAVTQPGIGDRNIGSDDEDYNSQQSSQTPEGNNTVKKETLNMLQMERKIMMTLQKEYGVPVRRDMGIENSKLYFDGVMDVGNRIYGIEIKATTDKQIWQRIFDRMTRIYSGFSVECKRRFVFMVCTVGDLPQEKLVQLERMAGANPFQTIVRHFPLSERSR
jgi:hypothetical protein